MSVISILRITLRRLLPALMVMVVATGCGQELAQENTALKENVASQKADIERLQRDLKLRDAKIEDLQTQLKTADAALAAMRLGATGPKTKIFATLKTNLGDVRMELFWRDAPKTVQNFVQLAEGTKQWTDPKTRERVRRPFYNGLTFHRVIPGFMIQGGDPKGNGSGGPGYLFEDEIVEGLGFDKTGLLAMANRGPNTNGSQFFITTGKPDYLDGKHTIFGEVVKGYDVVEKISNVPRERRDPRKKDRPLEDVIIKSVVIDRVN